MLIVASAGRAFAQSQSNDATAKPEAKPQRPAIVYLDRATSYELPFGDQKFEGLLVRELIRQALLIAARDELGLTTRDAWLDEVLPTEGENKPLDFVIGGNPPGVELVRGFAGDRALVVRHDWTAAVTTDYKPIVQWAEEMSRTKFVDDLKTVGFSGTPNPAAKTDESVPEEVEKTLAEMNFLSQFRAVNQLHRLIRDQGEAPALVGALARAYANLGVLTEFHWHPMHKVFKARALLYAQRMRIREPNNPVVSKWHWAYVFALVGMHGQALADLATVEETLKTAALNPAPQRPGWVDLMDSYCRFDTAALDTVKRDDPLYQLSRLLRFLAIEQSDSSNLTIKVAFEEARNIPECYRIEDSLCDHAGVGALHSATQIGPTILANTLYERMQAFADLPELVTSALQQQRAGDTTLGKILGGGPHRELRVRAQLIAALMSPNDADDKELSWRVLGRMIQDVSYAQSLRRISFERDKLSVSPDEAIAAARPLIAGHPLRLFIEAHAWDNTARTKAALEFAKAMPLDLVETREKELWEMFLQADRPLANRAMMAAFMHEDFVAYDMFVRGHLNVGQTESMVWGQWLLAVSPHSPYGRALLVEYGWTDDIAGKAAQWETEGARHARLQFALGWRYGSLNRLDDAERCLTSAIALDPTLRSHRELAALYRKQQKTDKWLATLEAFLKQPDYGLEHAQVQVEIANYYASEREWKTAARYADAAAETGAGWAMHTAASIHEALQEWEEAEQLYRDNAERYRGSETDWYFFCRRSGQGDLDAARAHAQGLIDRVFQRQSTLDEGELMAFCFMEGDHEKALAVATKSFNGNYNPYMGLHLALLCDQMGKAEQRDEALRLLKEKGNVFLTQWDGKPRGQLMALGEFFAADLAKGGKGELDFAEIDKVRSTALYAEQMNFNYCLAKYLSLHDKPDDAIKFWTECMAYPRMYDLNRTLAGFELWERGTTPGSYQDRLQKKPDAGGEKK